MSRVKICGIRCRRDALLAAACGADAVGVLVGQRHPSSDFIGVAQAAAILAALPPFVQGVLVSHLEDPDELSALVERTGARIVQVHGDMTPQGLRQLRSRCGGLTILKALHILGPEPPETVAAMAPLVDAVVADSANPRTGQVGGTGLVHDWGVTARLRARLEVPLILAGGLEADNVGQAIARVRPYAVDVNSGVKGSDGFKDPSRMRAFITAVRRMGAGSPTG
ncbi:MULTISPECIES: phosphoribosylanthranilate isomerase [Aphanothece]|uniref:phosphoribosylanthranilate isomerase n=1 Tax=Aphanothece TaxID=1121 RepID=UPI0039854084